MKKLLFVLLSAFYGFILSAQQPQIIGIPEKFLKPTNAITSATLETTDKTAAHTKWYVICDRDKNEVFTYQAGTYFNLQLMFGEKLAVIETSVASQRVKVARMRSKYDFQVLGWIPLNKLLLWNKSLVDTTFGFGLKAMIINRFTGDNSGVKVYRKPIEEKDTMAYEIHKGIFQFYFIFKEENGFYLIGKSDFIDKNAENVLYGWVKKENVINWNHRVAWEKNWDVRAVEERKRFVNDGIIITGNKTEAECLSHLNRLTQNTRNCIQSPLPYIEVTNNITQERKPGFNGRFPLLEYGNRVMQNQSVEVGVISEISLPDPGIHVNEEQINKLIKTMKDLRSINLIFVIDATEGMLAYSKAVKNGISSAIKEINRLQNSENKYELQNQFSFGAVLYRDEAMQYPVESFGQNLTCDTVSLFHWIDLKMTPSGNLPAPGKSPDRDREEAMFKGLDESINHYRPYSKNINFVILIGDCGDHQDSINRPAVYKPINEVVSLYKKHNINFMAFQVHHGDDHAYKLFDEQIKNFISLLLDLKSPVTASSQNPLLFAGSDYAPKTGRLKVCKPDQSVSVPELTAEIRNSILYVNNYINEKVKLISGILESKTPNSFESVRLIEFMMEMGFCYSEIRSMFATGLIQNFIVGYATMRSVGCNHDLCKPVVLFEQKELQELIHVLTDFSRSANYPVTQIRSRMTTVFQSLIRSYGISTSDKNMNYIVIGKSIEAITGKECKNPLICDLTISDIIDPRKLPDAKIREIIDYFKKYQDKLVEIYQNIHRYPARIEIPDSRLIYVWIPAEELP